MSRSRLWFSALFTALVAVTASLLVQYAIERSLNTGDFFTALSAGIISGVAILLTFRNWRGKSCG